MKQRWKLSYLKKRTFEEAGPDWRQREIIFIALNVTFLLNCWNIGLEVSI